MCDVCSSWIRWLVLSALGTCLAAWRYSFGIVIHLIPIYNEEANLPLLYEKIKGVDLSQYEREIIFINDGSTDNSASVLNAIAEADPSVLVIHFRRNFGQDSGDDGRNRLLVGRCYYSDGW